MKKIVLFLGCCVALFANNPTTPEDFFYNRGYEMGYSSGFDDGVRETFKEAKKILESYKDDLYAYELGKYLIRSQRLTYPQIWQEKTDDGRVVLKIMPSKIEREINIDDLFNKFSYIPNIKQNKPNKLEISANHRNSISLSGRDSNINEMPQKVNTASKKHTLRIKKNSKNLEILKRANVVFSDEDTSYNVLFFTEKEERDFCRQFEICK